MLPAQRQYLEASAVEQTTFLWCCLAPGPTLDSDSIRPWERSYHQILVFQLSYKSEFWTQTIQGRVPSMPQPTTSNFLQWASRLQVTVDHIVVILCASPINFLHTL